MSILDSTSLVNTLDRFNQRILSGEGVPRSEGLEVARWIAGQQGLAGNYRGMFAPTPDDFEHGIHVYSGEAITHASARHIMGQEAARAICLLGCQDVEVQAAYARATAWIPTVSEAHTHGTFCCGRCTPAFWRHYWVADFPDKELLLTRGLEALKAMRLSDGTWGRYPFFYTVLTLLDIDLAQARAELQYARPVMQRYLCSARRGRFAARRKQILELALERI